MPENPKQRDWYDCVSLVIAVLGLLGLWYYAYWARIQAGAMKEAANATALEAQTARDEFRTNRLALMDPSLTCKGNPGSPLDMTVSISAVNAGNSRAGDVWVGWWFEIGGQEPYYRGDSTGGKGSNYNRVAPKLDRGETSLPANLPPVTDSIVTADPEMRTAIAHEIQRGDKPLTIVGHINYVEATGQHQSQPFRYEYRPTIPTADTWSCDFRLVPLARPTDSTDKH